MKKHFVEENNIPKTKEKYPWKISKLMLKIIFFNLIINFFRPYGKIGLLLLICLGGV